MRPDSSDSALLACAREARVLAEQYESVSFESVHAPWMELLPKTPAQVLDIGAGSGRDAAWLAQEGYTVTAVEPVAEMRAQAQFLHAGATVHWRDDRLPGLNATRALGQEFELVLLSAVWMHLAPVDRPEALSNLAALMAPGALLMITLRHGPSPPAWTRLCSDRHSMSATGC